MQIQPNSSDNRNPALRFDPTRKAREAIQTQQPLPPEAPEPGQEPAAEDPAAQVKAARDAYREQRQQRLSNVRKTHTANHVDERAAEVTKARDSLRAQLAQRQDNVEKARAAKSNGADKIDISDASSKLADELLARGNARDEARAARVQELRARYLDGRLNSADLVERSARKLLGGE